MTTAVEPCTPPPGALLNRVAAEGAYTDCFAVNIGRGVSQAEFVEAFYTTRLFKLERWILRLAVSRASTDAEARQLARGERDRFAAWSVEGRAPDQLLLADFAGRTKSWLMVVPSAGGGVTTTRLFFGSAVVPVRSRRGGEARMGFAFTALLGFHKLYSRLLLRAARARLLR